MTLHVHLFYTSFSRLPPLARAAWYGPYPHPSTPSLRLWCAKRGNIDPPPVHNPYFILLGICEYVDACIFGDVSKTTLVTLSPVSPTYIKTTAAVFCLSSSRSTARSTLYSPQTGVASCRRQHVERPSVPHHICTVTRGL